MPINASVTNQQITASVSGDDISVSVTGGDISATVSGGIGPAASEYSLPTATASVLGGVKIGSGVTITDGVISVSTSYAAASHNHAAADITSGTIAAARLPLATTTQAQDGASTSVVATPGRLNEWLRSRYILTTSDFQSSTSGQILVQNAFAGITQLRVGSASGVGTLSIYSLPGLSPTLPKWNGTTGNFSGRHINWTRPVRLSARFVFGNALPTINATFRVLLGKAVLPTAANVAALAHRGIGCEIRNTALWLTTHDGTSRTDTQATSVTFATNSAYEVVAESDGSGTANLYLDGTLVATSSGAPTTAPTDPTAQQYMNIEATCTDSAESQVIFSRQIIVTQI